jgi:hypothetical protein
VSFLRVVAAVLWVLAAAGVALGAATARAERSGEKEIELSTAALKAGDPHGAAEHARRAAGWYVPGAPHVSVAYDRLLALGKTAEGLGDRDTALYAFRGVRTAAIETRWLVTPHEADLALADRSIARIEAEAPRAPAHRNDPPSAVEREQLAALALDDAPETAWVVALVAGALAFAAGAAVVARAIGPTGVLSWRRGLPGIVVGVVGAALWLIAVWRA